MSSYEQTTSAQDLTDPSLIYELNRKVDTLMRKLELQECLIRSLVEFLSPRSRAFGGEQ